MGSLRSRLEQAQQLSPAMVEVLRRLRAGWVLVKAGSHWEVRTATGRVGHLVANPVPRDVALGLAERAALKYRGLQPGRDVGADELIYELSPAGAAIDSSDPRPLLILSCSARKDRRPGELPAYVRYDGPWYRVLRRRGWPDGEGAPPVRVLVLSAEYGLIDALCPLPVYDRRMDAARAAKLAELPAARLRARLALQETVGIVPEVLFAGGELYRGVIERWRERELFPARLEVHCARGGIGEQQSAVARWLGVQTLAPQARRPR
jgi:hypothetical protein